MVRSCQAACLNCELNIGHSLRESVRCILVWCVYACFLFFFSVCVCDSEIASFFDVL